MNQINFLIQTIAKHSNVTSFIKSIQFNDRFGCVTIENGERFYPELVNGKTVSMFLKDLFKSIKLLQVEENEAVEEILNIESNEEVETPEHIISNDNNSNNIETDAQTIISESIALNQQNFKKCAWNYTSEETKKFKTMLNNKIVSLNIQPSIELYAYLNNEGFTDQAEVINGLLNIKLAV